MPYNSPCTQDIECENAIGNNNNNCFNNNWWNNNNFNWCIDYSNLSNVGNNKCQRQQLICTNGFCA